MEAITKTDAAVGTVYEACEEAGYILLVTADHGNAEQMINPDTGAPHTAHTTNAVPFIMTGDPKKYQFVQDKEGDDEEAGALCDVALRLEAHTQGRWTLSTVDFQGVTRGARFQFLNRYGQFTSLSAHRY